MPDYVNSLTLPAEKWEQMTEAYSGMNTDKQMMCDSKPKICKPVSVKVKTIGDRQYTTFGMCHGDINNSYIQAWELWPESEYDRPTHITYHDEAAIDAGLRERGDLEGLIVTHKGRQYVLTRFTEIKKSLPSRAAAVSLREAREFDKSQSEVGWRTTWFKSATPVWRLIEGFPVVTYRSAAGHVRLITMLFYRLGKHIVELNVNNDDRFVLRDPALILRSSVAAAMKTRSVNWRFHQHGAEQHSHSGGVSEKGI